jgi:DNA repair exonuclease SbcCD ATPase subunit
MSPEIPKVGGNEVEIMNGDAWTTPAPGDDISEGEYDDDRSSCCSCSNNEVCGLRSTILDKEAIIQELLKTQDQSELRVLELEGRLENTEDLLEEARATSADLRGQVERLEREAQAITSPTEGSGRRDLHIVTAGDGSPTMRILPYSAVAERNTETVAASHQSDAKADLFRAQNTMRHQSLEIDSLRRSLKTEQARFRMATSSADTLHSEKAALQHQLSELHRRMGTDWGRDAGSGKGGGDAISGGGAGSGTW